MAPRKKKYDGKTCCKPLPTKPKRGSKPQPIKPKRNVRKPEVTCPQCKGSGKIAKKKGKKPAFAYFFQHVCRRAREGDVQQNRKITMQRASECWNVLTPEQKAEFEVKAKRGLGNFGGRPKSSGGPGPKSSKNSGCIPRSDNHHDSGPSVSFKRDALNWDDTKMDFVPSSSECDVRTSSSEPKPEQWNDEEDSKDDDDTSFSPFGRFEYNPTGKYL